MADGPSARNPLGHHVETIVHARPDPCQIAVSDETKTVPVCTGHKTVGHIDHDAPADSQRSGTRQCPQFTPVEINSRSHRRAVDDTRHHNTVRYQLKHCLHPRPQLKVDDRATRRAVNHPLPGSAFSPDE